VDALGNITDPIIPANAADMRFPAYWDAELRAYEYLNEFIEAYTNPTLPANQRTWEARVNAGVGALTSPHRMTAANLRIQVIQMLDRAPDRPDRFNEIISQHSGEGAISYFLGMLMVDPVRMPAVNLLIRVARRIGEHISMCLKGQYRCPRPSQLCAAIVPMIDPPATPSFPSGHSLQAQLIARCLLSATPPAQPDTLVRELANRIGENRIIAGLHYPADHLVGQQVANWCFANLLTGGVALPLYTKLVTEATKQLASLGTAGGYAVDQP
jgi:acid phosphatase (class A)